MSEKFEIFKDWSYFEMICVRPIGDRAFMSPDSYHFATWEEAEKFKEQLEKENE